MSTLIRAVWSKSPFRIISVRRELCSSSSGDGDSSPKKLKRYAHLVDKEPKPFFQMTGKSPVITETDVLILGGGIMGSSVAYWLKKTCEHALNVTVIEKDPTYSACATTRSAGGIRQQFSLPENVQCSLFGAEFLRNFRDYLGPEAPDPQYTPEGYLFFTNTDTGAEQMEANVRMQTSLGARVELLSPESLNKRFPFIKSSDIKLASYGRENEGWFDPWSLLQGIKQYNLRNNVAYVNAEVVDFVIEDVLGLGHDRQRVHNVVIKYANDKLQTIKFANVVIACGANSGNVCRLLNMGEGEGIFSVPLPVEPRKRSIFSFHAPDAPILGFPFLIDPTGLYVRREGLGGNFISGKSPEPCEENLSDVDVDTVDETYFNEKLWPALAERVPAFNNLKLTHSWSGCYDYNYLDENAIVGAHPYFFNVYFCTGFSGHGLQMGPAVGRAVMELVLRGQYKTIDLRRFGFERVILGEPILEQGIV